MGYCYCCSEDRNPLCWVSCFTGAGGIWRVEATQTGIFVLSSAGQQMRPLTYHQNDIIIRKKIPTFDCPSPRFLKLGCGWPRRAGYHVARGRQKGPIQDLSLPKWCFGGFLNLVLDITYTVSPKEARWKARFALFTPVSIDECILILKQDWSSFWAEDGSFISLVSHPLPRTHVGLCLGGPLMNFQQWSWLQDSWVRKARLWDNFWSCSTIRKPRQIDFNSINGSKISAVFLGCLKKNYTRLELATKMKSHWLLDWSRRF